MSEAKGSDARSERDAAFDLVMQKIELRIHAKHRYDSAHPGPDLNNATHQLDFATGELRRATTDYHTLLDAHFARVIEENTPKVSA